MAGVLAVAGLSACGSDDDADTTAAQTNSQNGQSEGKAAKDDKANKGNGKSKSGSAGNSSGGDASNFKPKQHDDSGGGSEQFRVKGGDNSVQEFGEEATGEEFEDAASAVHNFLDARAEGEWAAACGYLADDIVKSFEKLASQAKEVDGTDCSEILGKLTNPAAKGLLLKEAKRADVGSLRTEGDRAFVIYRGLDGSIMAMAMTREDGEWKVASLAGTPLN